MGSETKRYGIIGDPIEHTISPAIHNAAFKELKLDYIYLPYWVRKDELGAVIQNMRTLDIKGLNVTIPHKIAVIQYLDELDLLAAKIGAVNTIVNNYGVLKGYNTDALGFLFALQGKGIKPEGKEVVILGAGGAARAIFYILDQKGSNLTVINRTLDNAIECTRISKRYHTALELNKENLIKALEKADILVNTISAGIQVTADMIKPNLIVFDIVYNPVKTRLLKEAIKAGAVTINGIDMLLWQGALSFERWTGFKVPIGIMRAEIIKNLR